MTSSEVQEIGKWFKIWLCERCGFTSKNHPTSCPAVVTYECSTCDKSFKTLALLKNHQVCHRNSSFKCPECDVTCKRKADAVKHAKLHEINCEFYNCSQCGKQFRKSFILI